MAPCHLGLIGAIGDEGLEGSILDVGFKICTWGEFQKIQDVALPAHIFGVSVHRFKIGCLNPKHVLDSIRKWYLYKWMPLYHLTRT